MPWRCVSGGTGANCEDFVRARPVELVSLGATSVLCFSQVPTGLPVGTHGITMVSRGGRWYTPRETVGRSTGTHFVARDVFLPWGPTGKKHIPRGPAGIPVPGMFPTGTPAATRRLGYLCSRKPASYYDGMIMPP